jgi:Nucleotidyltransferase domain.
MTDNGQATLLLGRSKVRQRILALLVEAPERRLHLRAIARAVGTSAGTTARELSRLEQAGLLGRTREGNQVYFQARPEQPLFGPIRDIVRQTIGAPATISRSLAGLAGVERAVIFGSYARGPLKPDSDVDLLIIGTPDRDELTERLETAGREISRPINEVVMTADELDGRRARGDRFIESIEAGTTIPFVEAPEVLRNEPDPIGIAIARRMRQGLRDIYRKRLRGVFLYGSRARGEQGPDSDVDVLIVLDRVAAYGEELERTSKLASDLSLDAGVIVSRAFASEADWRTGAKPFLVNARMDALEA